MKHPTIKENHLFSKAYAKGQSRRGRLVAVYVLGDRAYGRLLRADPHRKPFNRIGLTVSKTVGGAVVRSRVRRILRAGLAEAEGYAPMKSGRLIVLCARSAAATAKSGQIARELISHFRALGLYRSPEGGCGGGDVRAGNLREGGADAGGCSEVRGDVRAGNLREGGADVGGRSS